MIREAAKKYYTNRNSEFRFRGEQSGRLENFSDACFALAITLLLISTSPPTSFDQIRRFVYDLLPFTCCIILIILIWTQHFAFFFRYGLRDGTVIVLNTAFLIIVMFYVYPLKFLTHLMLIPVSSLTGNNELRNELINMINTNADWADLMIIYGIGGASVFFILYLMYRYALKKADELQLSEVEILDTRVSARTNLLMGIIPVISVIVAIIFRGSWTAGLFGGMVYMLYTPVMFIHGHKADRQRTELLKRLAASNQASVESPVGEIKEIEPSVAKQD